MLMETHVLLMVAPMQINYYRSKGYICDIPSLNNNMRERWYQLIVNIDDLLPKTDIVVTRICDDCGKIDQVRYLKHQFSKCWECAHKRPVNYQHCEQCGKDLGHWNKDTKLCRKCWEKSNKLNHPSLGKTKFDYDANRPNTYKYKIKEWRKNVKDRDIYTCQVCSNTDGKIVAHHLYDQRNFPDKIFDINNGVTLCNSCHLTFHNKYGHYGKPVTASDFYKFLQEINKWH